MAYFDSLAHLKVLIVEDQPEMRSILRTILSEFGMTDISEAGDGQDAIKFLGDALDSTSLIICDWNMPEMSGVDLLRQIRSVKPSMPFLMITGRGDLDSVVEAKTSGVTAYLRKPFTPKQLEAKLRIITQRMAA